MIDLFLEDGDLLEIVETEMFIDEGFFNRNKLSEKDVEIINNIKKTINESNYNDEGEIKVGAGSMYCLISFLLNTSDSHLFKNIELIKNRDLPNIGKHNNSGEFSDIESLAKANINSEQTLLNFMEKYKPKRAGVVFAFDQYESNSVIKYLKDKNIHALISDNHDKYIMYCYDDKCCYICNSEFDDKIKISISQLLSASKIAYNDLMKVISIYNKK